MKMKSFYKNMIYIIIISFLQFQINSEEVEEMPYNKSIGAKCSSNLECNSACCSSDKCDETSECEKLVTIVYICEAVLCFLFIVGFTIYLIIKLRRIKEDFKKKTQSEEEQNKQKEN